jgi:HD-like signal output (HDOD) protein
VFKTFGALIIILRDINYFAANYFHSYRQKPSLYSYSYCVFLVYEVLMVFVIDSSEREILERFSLPPRPKVLNAIHHELRRENVSFAVIARLIAEDVSISSAALSLVNAPVFRRVTPASSIDQALNVLGLKRVLAIVNAVSIRKAIKTAVDLEEFWEFGTTVANIALLFAQKLKKNTLADDAYTVGLFHDACAPFLMTQFPSYREFFIDGCAEGWLVSIFEEKENYGTTHTILAALMAQDWLVPDYIVNAIYNVHNAHDTLVGADDREPSVILLAILKCAREVARIHCYGQTDNPEWQSVKLFVLQALNLEEADYIEYRDDILEALHLS